MRAKQDLRISPLNSFETSSLKRGYNILLNGRREDQLGQIGINLAMSRSPIIKTEAPLVTLLEAIVVCCSQLAWALA